MSVENMMMKAWRAIGTQLSPVPTAPNERFNIFSTDI